MINAKAETLVGRQAYRNAFKRRRGLIPADGFYEWKQDQGGNQPYYIHFVLMLCMASVDLSA